MSAGSQLHATQQQAAGDRPNHWNHRQQLESADSLQHASRQRSTGQKPNQLTEPREAVPSTCQQDDAQQRAAGNPNIPQQLESAGGQQHASRDQRADWHRPNLFLGIMDRRHRWKGANRAARPALTLPSPGIPCQSPPADPATSHTLSDLSLKVSFCSTYTVLEVSGAK